jgi:metal-responsive CopG/Arc/MetJ family transcriptional regulator
MNTDNVRLNITLPRELAHALDRLTGPRKRSGFIAEALRQRIEQMEKQELEKILEEGYRSANQENLTLAKEFEAIDLEGWDEY